MNFPFKKAWYCFIMLWEKNWFSMCQWEAFNKQLKWKNSSRSWYSCFAIQTGGYYSVFFTLVNLFFTVAVVWTSKILTEITPSRYFIVVYLVRRSNRGKRQNLKFNVYSITCPISPVSSVQSIQTSFRHTVAPGKPCKKDWELLD